MSKEIFTVQNGQKVPIKDLYYILNSTPIKISKGYTIINQQPRLFYSSLPFSFTGNYSEILTIENEYSIYCFTTNGTLSLFKEDVQFWLCGGGGGGGSFIPTNSTTIGGPGGGGGGGYFIESNLPIGTYSLVIGQGGISEAKGENSLLTSINETVQWTAEGGNPGTFKNGTLYGGNGASGGAINTGWRETSSSWWMYSSTAGKGNNVSTIPFGESFLDPHCAGGGSGATDLHKGTTGGSNGSSGQGASDATVDTTYPSILKGGLGGEYGGGNGGDSKSTGTAELSNGKAATFYGGGGGGAAFDRGWTNKVSYQGGRGYQGVFYLKIPL